MSLKVIKAGILDTVQDLGRNGYQYLGINPGGAMDRFAAQTVNLLVGNGTDEGVIEMHFPAAAFLIEQAVMIAIGGADFSPTVDGEPIPLWHPVLINKNSVLQFEQLRSGARCYVAVKGLSISPWLNSDSTNLKAGAGGFDGRSLKKDDVLKFKSQMDYSKYLLDKEMVLLPWQADIVWNHMTTNEVFVVPGNEFSQLDDSSKSNLVNHSFIISPASDRMGYRLSGTNLTVTDKTELISSAVSFGTIQLLPDGQLIVLMADHQTTGGYPRVAHVITVHLPLLAQLRAGEKINFSMTDIKTAQQLLIKQKQHLLQLQNACTFRLLEFFHK